MAEDAMAEQTKRAKVWFYLRVSTSEQKQFLEWQFNRLKYAAGEKNWEMVGYTVDICRDIDLNKRPGGAQVFDNAAQQHADMVVAAELTRASRKESIILQFCRRAEEMNMGVDFAQDSDSLLLIALRKRAKEEMRRKAQERDHVDIPRGNKEADRSR